MTEHVLNIAEPFFAVKFARNEEQFHVDGSCILLNVSDRPIRIVDRELPEFQSRIVRNATLHDVEKAVIVEDQGSAGGGRHRLRRESGSRAGCTIFRPRR